MNLARLHKAESNTYIRIASEIRSYRLSGGSFIEWTFTFVVSTFRLLILTKNYWNVLFLAGCILTTRQRSIFAYYFPDGTIFFNTIQKKCNRSKTMVKKMSKRCEFAKNSDYISQNIIPFFYTNKCSWTPFYNENSCKLLYHSCQLQNIITSISLFDIYNKLASRR